MNFSRTSMTALIILVVTNCIKAQNIKFTIADEFDSLGVQYATVCYKTKSQYCTFSDSLGLASCIGFDDSLIITRTGYKSKVIHPKGLKYNDTVFLKKDVAVLPNVFLTKNVIDNSEFIGNTKKKNGSIYLIPNLEIGRSFITKSSQNILKSVSIFFRTRPQSSHLFLLSIYKFSVQLNKPSTKVFEQVYRINPLDDNSYKHIFELENSITIDSNFFVAIKYLGSQVVTDRIELITSNRWKDIASYERYFSEEWVTEPNLIFLKNRFSKGANNILMQVEVSAE